MKKRKEDRLKDAMENYKKLLLHMAYSYLGREEDAEDVVQEAFLAYYQKAPDFCDAEHEKAWLLKVTKNKCKNELKSAWVRKTVFGEEKGKTNETFHSEILEMVLSLPLNYREVICLYYIEGYSIKETAELLGRSQTAVGTQLQRARKLLRIEWEESS